MDACDFLIFQDFELDQLLTPFQGFPDLAVAKQFVSRYPELAIVLIPADHVFRHFKDASEGLFLIEISQHCSEVSRTTANLIIFDPTLILEAILGNNYITDDERAQLVSRLCEMGADVNEELNYLARIPGVGYEPYFGSCVKFLRRFSRQYPKSYRAVLDYIEFSNQIKEPGVD